MSKFVTKTSWLKERREIQEDKKVLLDLRSPKEYAEGHIPKAWNLPLLNNEERHEVGLLYKTEGKTPAVQKALEIFSQKVPAFLETLDTLANKRDIVLYCWRGGMRSNMTGFFLKILGYRVSVLEGGHKKFRHSILETLEHLANHSLLVLNGKTGVGKTELIQELSLLRCPVLDFEKIACHRGSAFGDFAQDKISPTQQNFENNLADSYLDIQHYPKILVEIENCIGPVRLPISLHRSIIKSPMIFLDRDMIERVQYIEKIYTKDWSLAVEEKFVERMELVKKFLSKKDFEEITINIKGKQFSKVIQSLLELRYDKTYEKSLTRHKKQAIKVFDLSTQKKLAVEFLQNFLQAH